MTWLTPALAWLPPVPIHVKWEAPPPSQGECDHSIRQRVCATCRQAGPPSLGPAGVARKLELHMLLLAGMLIAYWALNAKDANFLTPSPTLTTPNFLRLKLSAGRPGATLKL